MSTKNKSKGAPKRANFRANAAKAKTAKIQQEKQKWLELDEAAEKQRIVNQAISDECSPKQGTPVREKTELEKLQEQRKSLEDFHLYHSNTISRLREEIRILQKDISHIAIECESIASQVLKVNNEIKVYLINKAHG
jgi:chromosome segregation ATPase